MASEIESLEKIVQKLDESIDKLTEVSNNVSKLLAVHDTRLNVIEKDTVRNEDDIRDIHHKIEVLVKELSIKIDQSMVNSTEGHTKIMEKVDEKIFLLQTGEFYKQLKIETKTTITNLICQRLLRLIPTVLSRPPYAPL